MIIKQADFGFLAICALRYSMGRQSYAPKEVQEIVGQFLGELTDNDLRVMIQDCERQRRDENYGDPVIDKPGWIEWEQKLLKEWKSRGPQGIMPM